MTPAPTLSPRDASITAGEPPLPLVPPVPQLSAVRRDDIVSSHDQLEPPAITPRPHRVEPIEPPMPRTDQPVQPSMTPSSPTLQPRVEQPAPSTPPSPTISTPEPETLTRIEPRLTSTPVTASMPTPSSTADQNRRAVEPRSAANASEIPTPTAAAPTQPTVQPHVDQPAPVNTPVVLQPPNTPPSTPPINNPPQANTDPPMANATPRASSETPSLVEAPRPVVRRTVDVHIGSVELRVQRAAPPEPPAAPAPQTRPSRGLEEYAARRSYRGDDL